MSTIPLGRYLWERIREGGTKTIMGVPGDYQLQLLDYIYEVGLRFIGNANELNASYAADGYARIKGVPGVVITTHGVGELSALNGIAGARAEQVRVIHIVGQTSRAQQEGNVNIHHSLGLNSDHSVYTKASDPISVATAKCWDVKIAPAEIDRVIRECFIHSRPVYIYLPSDIFHEEVPASLLEQKLDLSLPVDEEKEKAAAEAIVAALEEATTPCILMDMLVDRYHANDEALALVERLGIPVFASITGKGIIDETHPLYGGIYCGAGSNAGVLHAWEACDLVMSLGDFPSAANTGGFTRQMPPEKSIVVSERDVKVRGTTYDSTLIKSLLRRLASVAPDLSSTRASITLKPHAEPVVAESDDAEARQSWVWHRIADFLRPGDAVLCDVGTAQFAVPMVKFPAGVRSVAQAYYGSIGWATPSALGADVALQETHEETGERRGRTVLITGDGSMALTINETSTMIKEKARPVIIVVNNGGYTIERVIHGAKQPYNDIPAADYSHLLPLYRHPSPESSYHYMRTSKEVNAVLSKPELEAPEVLHLIELVLDPLDVPKALVDVLSHWRGPKILEAMKEAGFIM